MKKLSKYVQEKLIINKDYDTGCDVKEFTKTNVIFEIFVRYNTRASTMKDKQYMFVDCVNGKVTGSGNDFKLDGTETIYGANYDDFPVKATKNGIALYYHMTVQNSEHMYMFFNPEIYDNVISMLDKLQNSSSCTIPEMLDRLGIDGEELLAMMSPEMLKETYEIACVKPDKLIDALVG